MSLILDALRKSERARQQTLNGQISNVAPVMERSGLPTPWVTLIGLILLLNAIVLAFLLWRADQPLRAPTTPAASTMNAAVAAPQPLIRPLADEVVQPGVHDTVAQKSVTTTVVPSVPAETVPATPVATNLAAPSVPTLDSLPLAFQQSLPSLHLDVHSYAAKPADRFVVINMQRYVAGDTLKEGPHVIAVTQQGVILEYQGTRFLLPRN